MDLKILTYEQYETTFEAKIIKVIIFENPSLHSLIVSQRHKSRLKQENKKFHYLRLSPDKILFLYKFNYMCYLLMINDYLKNTKKGLSKRTLQNSISFCIFTFRISA